MTVLDVGRALQFFFSAGSMEHPKHSTQEQLASIVSLYKSGEAVKEISRIVGLAERTVQKWIKRYSEDGGEETPTHGKRSGRPLKITQRTTNTIRRQVEVKPRLSAKEIKENNPLLLADVSVRTVQRTLHDRLRYRSCRPRRKPLLTSRQIKNRIAFCRKYSEWDVSKWQRVLWTDEAIFSVAGNRGGNVYRRLGSDPFDPRYTRKTEKFPDSVMVWGAFGYYGQGNLVVLPRNENLNKDKYLELLCDHLPECFEVSQADIFMQDGAPCHTAHCVTQWLRDCEVQYIDDWPGNSPDFNPIENLWAIIKRKLRQHDTSSIPQLIAAVEHEWRNIDPQHLRNLSDSVPKRLKECLKNKGRPLKY